MAAAMAATRAIARASSPPPPPSSSSSSSSSSLLLSLYMHHCCFCHWLVVVRLAGGLAALFIAPMAVKPIKPVLLRPALSVRVHYENQARRFFLSISHSRTSCSAPMPDTRPPSLSPLLWCDNLSANHHSQWSFQRSPRSTSDLRNSTDFSHTPV